MGLEGVTGLTRGYRVTGSDKGLQKVTSGYKGYRGLEGVKGGDERLHRVTGGDNGLQRVTRGYNG